MAEFSAYEDMKRQRELSRAGAAVSSGFVRCPLCRVPAHSQKRYSLGRGLRMHFAAKHPDVADPSPWLSAAEVAAAEAQPAELAARGDIDHSGAKAPPPAALEAARAGDLEALQRMRAAGEWRPEDSDRHGSSAPHWAAGGGHVRLLQWLIAEVDPGLATVPDGKRKRRGGRQPLHWAARNGQMDVVRYLLESPEVRQRPSVDEPTHDGTTPLQLACFGRALEASQYLISSGAEVGRLNDWACDSTHWAAMGGCPRVLQLLGDTGAAWDRLQKEGHSPLHKAAQRGHLQAVQWMLSGPYSHRPLRDRASRPDTGGFRPSDIACAAGHSLCSALLAEAGC